MGDLDIEELRERLLPERKAYSVVRVDTMRPPGHPDCAVKMFETESLDEVSITPDMGEIWIAYHEGGDATTIARSSDRTSE